MRFSCRASPIFPCRHTTAASHSPTLTEESISRQPTAESTWCESAATFWQHDQWRSERRFNRRALDGEELNITTTNGGVNVLVPDNYSAALETGTVNGNVSFGFPVNVVLTERAGCPKTLVSIWAPAGRPYAPGRPMAACEWDDYSRVE